MNRPYDVFEAVGVKLYDKLKFEKIHYLLEISI